MKFSQLAESIAESPTLKLNEEARRLKELGQDVIHLGAGEPKNKAPKASIEAACAKLATGDIKYTPTGGTASLKKAIISYTEKNYGIAVSPGNVIVSAGAKQSLYNVLYALLNPEDEVIVLAPYWVSYPEMVRMVRGVPVIINPGDATYQITISQIEKAAGPRTRAVIINSPNNPSGVMYREEFVSGVVELCEARGIYCIMDDIYHKLIFDGKPAVCAYKYTGRDIESTMIVSINGISKTYGMTGFRIGWAVAGKKLTSVMANIQGQITTTASVICQAGAEGALNGPQDEVETLRMTMETNRDAMLRDLGAIRDLRVTKPDGTFYCLPDFRAYTGDSMALSDFLLKKALVVTVPGKEFGMEGHLRLSFCGSARDVSEGARRIRWALDPTAPREIVINNRTLTRDWT